MPDRPARARSASPAQDEAAALENEMAVKNFMMTGSVTKNFIEMAYDALDDWLFYERHMFGLQLNDLEGPRDALLPAVVTIEFELVSPLFHPCALEQND